MRFVLLTCALHFLLVAVSGFWDDGTTTLSPQRDDATPRQSFFMWQKPLSTWVTWFYPSAPWDWYARNRRTTVIGGISIDMLCIGTATILNRRTLITAANLLDPYYNRQRDLRIWLLGTTGNHNTPYRYRVWRITRLFPKSLNPEHWHGPRGVHSPRHDVCIIHSLDQMFIMNYASTYGMYPVRSYIIPKNFILTNDLWMGGSGYESLLHIRENYKISRFDTSKNYIVDCSKYLPKWWGKFICIINTANFPGIQNGMGLHTVDLQNDDYIAALGCFEIRYNEDRIMVFTDLRYYNFFIYKYCFIHSGEYYEYAYPQWGVLGTTWRNLSLNQPNIPEWQKQDDLFPLG